MVEVAEASSEEFGFWGWHYRPRRKFEALSVEAIGCAKKVWTGSREGKLKIFEEYHVLFSGGLCLISLSDDGLFDRFWRVIRKSCDLRFFHHDLAIMFLPMIFRWHKCFNDDGNNPFSI